MRVTFAKIGLIAVLTFLHGPRSKSDEAPVVDNDWSDHFQLTTVTQTHGAFHSPYAGENSLKSKYEIPSSLTSTLFVGRKLWSDAYIFVNPEESIGSGLSGTHGLAGFTNGEIYRVNSPDPTLNLSRLFFQQDFGLGGGHEKVADDLNQFAATKDVRRIAVIAGKFSLNDYLDNNLYSHDPRTQFLNWCLMDNCAWDYASDTRGYTWGIYGEYHSEAWSFRLAIVQEPAIANQLDFDGDIVHANSENFEAEYRYKIKDHPGAARFLSYTNHAHMGNYSESLSVASANQTIPNITSTETYRTKYGLGLNLEQEISADLGAFSRLGWDNGTTETWTFSEVDQTFSFGGVLKGSRWHRDHDNVGLAFIINGLDRAHADYLSAGGTGILLGDGGLSYAPEEIMEAYYLYQPISQLGITGDFQLVKNPGYNSDRGPVEIYALRMHLEI